MGEIAEMMLEGTLCVMCGAFVGDDAGIPVPCLSCRRSGDHTAKGPGYMKPDPNSNRSKKKAARQFQQALKERAERGYGSRR